MSGMNDNGVYTGLNYEDPMQPATNDEAIQEQAEEQAETQAAIKSADERILNVLRDNIARRELLDCVPYGDDEHLLGRMVMINREVATVLRGILQQAEDAIK